MKKTLNFILNVLLFAVFFANALLWSWIVYTHFSNSYSNRAHLSEMYNKIVAASGMSHDRIPIYVVDNPNWNAYTDGQRIVFYSGLVDNSSEDELAMVVAHEFAHHILMHTRAPYFDKKDRIVEAEAMADKMGGFLMMKAGYSLCNGRAVWRKFRDTRGNYLHSSHPNYSYRYDELNVNCE